MTDMSQDDAFKRLKLPPTATAEEIDAAFRQEALQTHPDTGGDSEAMKALVKARDVAQDAVRSRSLVGLSGQLAVPMSGPTALEQLRARREISKEAIVQVIKRQTSRYKRYRRTTALLGLLFGAVGLLYGLAIPQYDGLYPYISIPFYLLAVTFGLFYGIGLIAADILAQAIEDLGDTLDDKAVFVHLVYQVSGEPESAPVWSRDEMERWVKEWSGQRRLSVSGLVSLPISLRLRSDDIRTLARLIGASDFTRILVAKGLGSGVLQEDETVKGGRLIVRYSFSFLSSGPPESAKDLKDRIDTLYAPFLQVARSMLERKDYLGRFVRHMDRELGQLHRHLALPATIEAFDKRRNAGVSDEVWAKDLARAFIRDYNRLVEAYRRATIGS